MKLIMVLIKRVSFLFLFLSLVALLKAGSIHWRYNFNTVVDIQTEGYILGKKTTRRNVKSSSKRYSISVIYLIEKGFDYNQKTVNLLEKKKVEYPNRFYFSFSDASKTDKIDAWFSLNEDKARYYLVNSFDSSQKFYDKKQLGDLISVAYPSDRPLNVRRHKNKNYTSDLYQLLLKSGFILLFVSLFGLLLCYLKNNKTLKG